MSEMQDIQYGQEQLAEGAVQTLGLVGDILSAAATVAQKPQQNNSSLEKERIDVQAVLDAVDNAPGLSQKTPDFSQGRIPENLGIPELKDVSPQKLGNFDKDLAISWGFQLGMIEQVNENRVISGGPGGGFPNEANVLKSFQETRESMAKQIKNKGYTHEQLLKVAGYSPAELAQREAKIKSQQEWSDNYGKPQTPPLKTDQRPDIPSLDDAIAQDKPKAQPEPATPKVEAKPEPPKAEAIKSQPESATPKVEPKPAQPKQDEPKVQADSVTLKTDPKPSPEQQVGAEDMKTEAKAQQSVQSPKPTASNNREAKKEVSNLGKKLESELSSVLGSKVEARIYSGRSMVYPPQSKTSITPEMADKLNRAFTNPESVKGTIRLSIRGDDGKLNPVYQVSNGKVTMDKYNLSKAIAQELPKPKQEVENKARVSQSSSSPPEEKAKPTVTATPEPGRAQVDSPKPSPAVKPASQESDTKAQLKDSPKPEQEKVAPQSQTSTPSQDSNRERDYPDQATSLSNPVGSAKESLDARLNDVVAQLKDANQRLAKLEQQLKEKGIPVGLQQAVSKQRQSLGDRLKSLGQKATESIKGVGNKIDTAITNLEAGMVYRAGAFLAKSYGEKQSDGSHVMNHGQKYSFRLKGNDLTISRKADAQPLFKGDDKLSRITKAASLSEVKDLKTIPVTVGKIRDIQEQKLNVNQSQGRKVGGVKR